MLWHVSPSRTVPCQAPAFRGRSSCPLPDLSLWWWEGPGTALQVPWGWSWLIGLGDLGGVKEAAIEKQQRNPWKTAGSLNSYKKKWVIHHIAERGHRSSYQTTAVSPLYVRNRMEHAEVGLRTQFILVLNPGHLQHPDPHFRLGGVAPAEQKKDPGRDGSVWTFCWLNIPSYTYSYTVLYIQLYRVIQ